MGMQAAPRRRLGAWLIVVLLLTQWLAVAYACPSPGAQGVSLAGPAQAEVAACDGVSHAQVDPAYPLLCKAHCDADGQAPAQAAPQDPPLPSPGWFLVVVAAELPLAGLAAAGTHALPRAGAPPGWPALHLIHQVLRN